MSSHLDADIEWARWATERWADFPVGQIPRPLVLVEPGIRVEHGFSGPAKVTFGVGAVDGDESVPNAVLDVLRTPRLSVDRLPSRANVQVSNARLGECDFVTDRGPKRFAAWQMESEDALGPIWVLDPIIVARAWSPPEPPSRPRPFAGSPRRALAATASSDDYTITLTFVGGLPERIDYPSADVVETRTAVVILPRPTHREPIEAGGWVPAVGTTRTVTVDLGDPLGSRVLTDIDGPPVPVTSIR